MKQIEEHCNIKIKDMGLFNYIKIDESIDLPDFPKELNRNQVEFQTKDLDDNAMCRFRVNSERKLEIYKEEGEWVRNEAIKFLESEFWVYKSWWESYVFTGRIIFYESYDHPEYVSFPEETDEFFRFDRGWVEYDAKFVDGVLIEVRTYLNIPPVMRTDEEIEIICEKQEELFKTFDKDQRKILRELPTPEQKLIDSIYEITEREPFMPEIEDFHNNLMEIQKEIDEYRKKYDKYYERARKCN